MLALRTDLWTRTLLRVQSAHSAWGWASLTHRQQGAWPGAGCARSPPAPQPGTMLVGTLQGFCWAVPYLTAYPPGTLRLWDPARAGCEQGSSGVLRFAARPLAGRPLGRPELCREQRGAGVDKRRQGRRLGSMVQGC